MKIKKDTARLPSNEVAESEHVEGLSGFSGIYPIACAEKPC